MPFTDTQIKALSNKLSAKHVRTRQANGLTLSYIEGWHSIAEANRIFGYEAWDRQTMTVKCVWEGLWRGRNACSYIARVRVRVRTGDAEICREGCGSGHGTGLNPGEAHESAIKEAEMRAIVGRKSLDRMAASTNQMGRFETEWLVTDDNLVTLADIAKAPAH